MCDVVVLVHLALRDVEVRDDGVGQSVADLVGHPELLVGVRRVEVQVAYVPEVRTDGGGSRLTVAGGAVLRVQLKANVFDQLGHLHYDRRVGAHVADVRGYQTLRDVVYGGCFEGRTTFGVGVRARLPFRVFTLAGPGSRTGSASTWPTDGEGNRGSRRRLHTAA